MADVEGVLGKATDNQALAMLRDTQGNIAFVEGRLDAAYDELIIAGGMISWSAPTAYLTAARAALWLRDPVRARKAMDLLDTTTHGPAISAAHNQIEAGLLALAGDTTTASVRYRDVLEVWRDLGLPWDVALTAIEMAALLGPAGPGVDAAAAEAREILKRLGATRISSRLAEVMDWSRGPAMLPVPDGQGPGAAVPGSSVEDPAVPTT
jgi:hypothetical protein